RTADRQGLQRCQHAGAPALGVSGWLHYPLPPDTASPPRRSGHRPPRAPALRPPDSPPCAPRLAAPTPRGRPSRPGLASAGLVPPPCCGGGALASCRGGSVRGVVRRAIGT